MLQIPKRTWLIVASALLVPLAAAIPRGNGAAQSVDLAVPAYAAQADDPAQAESEAAPEEPALTLDDVRAMRFSDVPETDRLRDAVGYAACRGIMIGGDRDHFYPDAPVTRGQVLTVLRRLALEAGVLASEPEDDLQWAADAGVLMGTENGYEADATVTRAQMLTFLHRYAQYAGYDTAATDGLTEYVDASSVPEYAQSALAWASQHGLLRGLAGDALHCDLPMSREQVAAVLTALLADVEDDPLAEQVAEGTREHFTSASRAKHDELQSYVDAVAEKYGAMGVQVAVIEGGHVTDSFAYGWATRKSDPMTADHKMRIASISKVVLGMTAMRMRQDGLVDLDTPIGEYWGETFRNPSYPDKPINLRGILTHTSSIVMLDASSAYRGSSVRERQRGSGGYSRTTPGSIYSWGYNNYAFCVLGLTLELAGEKTIDQLLHTYFFDTLGIDASFYGGDIKDTGKLTTLYGHGGGVERSIETQKGFHAGAPGSSGSTFAGGLIISANDLAKLVAVLANDGRYEGVRLMSEDAVAQMEQRSDITVSDGFYQAMPLRYRTDIYGRDGLYFHTGSAYGVYNCVSYDPETGDGVVVLTTGASAAKDGYGIYAVCGSIFEQVYEAIGPQGDESVGVTER